MRRFPVLLGLAVLLWAGAALAGGRAVVASVYNSSGRALVVRASQGEWTTGNGAALPEPGLAIGGKGFQPFNAVLEPGGRAWVLLEDGRGRAWNIILSMDADGRAACAAEPGKGAAPPLVQRVGKVGKAVLFDVVFKAPGGGGK